MCITTYVIIIIIIISSCSSNSSINYKPAMILWLVDALSFQIHKKKNITLTHNPIVTSDFHIMWLYNPKIFNEEVVKKLSNTMLHTTLGTRPDNNNNINNNNIYNVNTIKT